jgi:hypothetical protein
MRFPDFFIVGAAKSGTTSLWYYLGQHPQIYMTKELAFKELGYFSPDYGISDRDKYLSFFADAKPHQLIGEACHPYLSSKESASLIKDHIPHAKIIIILRNPIERAYSLYNYLRGVGQETAETFEKALALESRRKKSSKFFHSNNRSKYLPNYFYVETGLYYEQVKRYVDTFDSNQLLIFLYEDLKRDKRDVYKKICNFLKVDPDFTPDFSNQNESLSVRSAKVQHLIRYHLTPALKKIKMPKALVSRTKNLLYALNHTNKRPSELKSETREFLKAKFKDDVVLTAQLIHRDLSKWTS